MVQRKKQKLLVCFLFSSLNSFVIFIKQDYSVCSSCHWVLWEAKGMPCSGGCHSVWPWSASPRCDPALCCKPRGCTNELLNPVQVFQLKHWEQSSQTLLDGYLARTGCARLAESRVGTGLVMPILFQPEIKESNLSVPLAYIHLSLNYLGF